MLAEFTVEMGGEAPALELPWVSADGTRQFIDLRAEPQRLPEIEEVRAYPPLREFLLALNARSSPLGSVKCDAWSTSELAEEDQIFGAPLKFVAYVDVVFQEPALQTSQARHEQFGQALCELLARAPELPCAAELVLRRCYFHDPVAPGASRDGYCLTLYVTGYGEEEEQARQRGGIALRLVQNAIAQIFARRAAS